MKRIFAMIAAAWTCAAMFAGTVNYTADDVTIFPNPERGFLRQTTRHAYNKNAVQSRTYELDNLAAEKGTLILVLYYLDEFIAEPTLPDSILNAFDADMAVLRDRGMKAIFRVAYAEHRNGEDCPDAPLSIIESHLDRFKSHWAANADVIYCFQAGFVGQYGEWYYTNNFTHHVSTFNEAERALLDTALKAIPQDRTLLLRRPMFKQVYLDGAALTEEEAYTGTAKARLGHFNDAFLYDYNNMGTYSDTSVQKPFIAQETLYVPLGGETDITKDSLAYAWASHDSTIAEMSYLHWSFIKSTYSETVTNKWRANGTFDDLNRLLGYRYQLIEGTYGENVSAGGDLSVNIQIKNVGFAPLYNERPAYIVLKNGNNVYPLRLTSDPRTWKPNGVVSTINETLTVPADVPTGTYDLYLWLPDAYVSIAADPRYAVRFANTGVWEEATGMNALNAQVVVSGGEEPEDTSVPLPATLDKANHSAVSAEKWYETDYFNFGDDWGVDDSDGHNLSRWIEWQVNLKYPGNYIVSEVGYYPNSHKYALLLLDGETIVATDTTAKSNKTGYDSITQDAKWNLSMVSPGVYTLRVKNVIDYGKPKLKSLTLTYDGDIPSAVEQTETEQTNKQAFDLLGRPVNDDYKGIVIMRGKKQLRL